MRKGIISELFAALLAGILWLGLAMPAYAQPANSPWPMFCHDPQHTGRSPYKGPEKPKLEWSYQTKGEIHSSPAIGPNGTVYVGSNDYSLYAINPDGSFKWKYQTGSKVRSSPAVGFDGTVYVGSDDKYFYAINPDGSLKWKYQTGGYGIYSSPVIGSDGTIYVGSSDKYVYALSPNGFLKWKYDGKGRCGSPTIGADGAVWVAGGSYLHAINPNGSYKMAYKAGGPFSPPAIGSNGVVYVGSYEEKQYTNKMYLRIINPRGSVLQRDETWVKFKSSPAIGSDGTIYVASFDNYLYAINPDGSLKWKSKTGKAIYSSPAIGQDGIVHVASSDGKLYAISRDGSLKWSFTVGGSFGDSSPAIDSNGTIYVGSRDGKLYAIGADTPQDRTLVQSGRIYWLQNGKLYWVNPFALEEQRKAGLTGWSKINRYPLSVFDPSKYPKGPVLVTKEQSSSASSTGLLIKGKGDTAVYLIWEGTRRSIKTDEAMRWLGANYWPDVIEVASSIRDYFSAGPDIHAIGAGSPSQDIKDRFINAYGRHEDTSVSGFPGSVSSYLGFPSSAVRRWSKGYIQDFRASNGEESAIMQPDGVDNAYAVYGDIWTTYAQMGGPTSWLGFPVSDVYINASGHAQSDFEGGYITTLDGINYQAFHMKMEGENSSASISVDLELKRVVKAGNQQNTVLYGVQPNTTVLLSLYTKNVSNLIGYTVAVKYDSNFVIYDSGSFSNLALGELNGLIQWSPSTVGPIPSPTDPQSIGMGAEILVNPPGADEAVDGSGHLLGILQFTTKRDFQAGDQAAFWIDGITYRGVDRVTCDVRGNLDLTKALAVIKGGLLSDFNKDGQVWLEDFILFVGKFGFKQGDAGFDPIYDLDRDGRVWTSDFSIFVSQFGKTSGAAKVVAVSSTAGRNQNAKLILLAHKRTTSLSPEGTELTVDIYLKDAAELRGYGIIANYDPEVLEFLGATPDNKAGQRNLLNSRDGSTPLFLAVPNQKKPGQVWIANALADSKVVDGSGLLAEVCLRVIGNSCDSLSPLSLAAVELFDGQLHRSLLSAEMPLKFVPDDYALGQNWPNPFNALTNIHYQLPERRFVSLKIYNSLGQLVRMLVEGEKPAGHYSVQWDGKDSSGRDVASGIYLYRLQVRTGHGREDFTQTRRMILLR